MIGFITFNFTIQQYLNFQIFFCQLATFLLYNSLELFLCLIGLIVLLKISLSPYGAYTLISLFSFVIPIA